VSSDRTRLDGRTALVTGGRGFLGRQWTAALVDAGATVVTVDVASAVERDDADTRVRHERLDITDPGAVQTLAARLTEDSLAVDVLVNNAAIDAPVLSTGLADGDRLEAFSLDRWNTELSVGLTGAFLCAQTFGPAMAERGRGSIVNIASDLGLVAPDQRLYRVEGAAEESQPVKPVTYSVIKTGIIGLTRYLSTYWARQGVRANALCLGGVAREQDPAFVERVSERIPLGRMARPDEYRDAMVFLCSDASSYMTGACLVLDGGRTVW
jgi:NAD(P)-dependent dehydrogenase (short-subunit alcohol dehydrogenase family)